MSNNIIAIFESIKNECTTVDGKKAVEKCERALQRMRPVSLSDAFYYYTERTQELDSYVNEVPIYNTVYGRKIDEAIGEFDKKDLRKFISDQAKHDEIEPDKEGIRGEIRFPLEWQINAIHKFIVKQIKLIKKG